MLRSLLACLCLVPLSALADGESFKVAEVFVGSIAHPDAQYIMLRATSDGQSNVVGKSVTITDYSGDVVYTFDAPLTNGGNQSRILLATPAAETLFGVQADLVIAPLVNTYSSIVCYENIDCASWGSYEDLPDGSTYYGDYINDYYGFALTRNISNAGDPLALEPEDDTNDGYADWVHALPNPINNAGQAGTRPESTCGDFEIQGLEGCDDGNTLDGDDCSSNCKADYLSWGYCGNWCSVSPVGDRGSWGVFALFFGLFLWVGSRRVRSRK